MHPKWALKGGCQGAAPRPASTGMAEAEGTEAWDAHEGEEDEESDRGTENAKEYMQEHERMAACGAALQHWAEEEEILQHAWHIRSQQHSQLPQAEPNKWQEPERERAHWDHVLGECVWLSNDLTKERAWKQKTAKRFAHLASKEALSSGKMHHLTDAAPIENAKHMAATVKYFWRQAEKIAQWRRLQQFEERRQAALDKHLEELLSKTEAYSASIANSLLLRSHFSESGDPTASHTRVEHSTAEHPHAGHYADANVNDGQRYSSQCAHDVDAKQSVPNWQRCNGEHYDDSVAYHLHVDKRRGNNLGVHHQEGDIAHFEDRQRNTTSADENWATAEWYDIEETIERDEEQHEEGEIEALQQEQDEDLEAIRARLQATEDVSGDEEEEDEEEEEEDVLHAMQGEGEEEREEISQEGGRDNAEGTEEKGEASDMTAQRAMKRKNEDSDVMAGDDDHVHNAEGDARIQEAEMDKAGPAELPFILKGRLRQYQLSGLDWLTTLYKNRLNGILADEMGLGKTIQTIALLSWLACEKGIWGPHLVVAPTSVLVNWEAEFKRWAPAMRVLTYFGKPEERKQKRKGWNKASAFHVCLTTYTLATQESSLFRRKRWRYLILDEAHLIKNWRSQRWQSLLDLRAARRLLLTGTPLQNRLDELWALLHFLMPSIFASQEAFKRWFSQPLAGVADGGGAIDARAAKRLHAALRPFLLRRVKQEVERELPQKHEHLIRCRLARRQRRLYEEHVRSDETQRKLLGANPLGPLHVLMELRKICNHPDLLSPRTASSPFATVRTPLKFRLPAPLSTRLVISKVPLSCRLRSTTMRKLSAAQVATPEEVEDFLAKQRCKREPAVGTFAAGLHPNKATWKLARRLANEAEYEKCWRMQRYAHDLQTSIETPCSVDLPPYGACHIASQRAPEEIVELPRQKFHRMKEWLRKFCIVQPRALAPIPSLISPMDRETVVPPEPPKELKRMSWLSEDLRPLDVTRWIVLPDTSTLQQDSGKLQALDPLLRQLKASGSRAVIFTQMSKVLDILESFLNKHGHRYVRLDGNTNPERRQKMVERFNNNSQLLCCLASTRTGGVGVNLTGANTVIFFDSDWNPAQDAQAQDRTHRIGQTRDVHVYRLVSEGTVEANVLTKQLHKRNLGALALSAGNQIQADDSTGGSLVTGAVDSVLQRIEQSQEGTLESMLAGAEDAEDVSALKAARHEQKEEQAQLDAEVGNEGSNGGGERAATCETDQAQQEEKDDGQDRSVPIESLLRPFELYALRFLEEQNSVVGLEDVEAQVAREEAEWRQQEQNIEVRREYDEAAAEGEDTDGLATIEAHWDKARAKERYKASLSNAQSLAMHAFNTGSNELDLQQLQSPFEQSNGYHPTSLGKKRRRGSQQNLRRSASDTTDKTETHDDAEDDPPSKTPRLAHDAALPTYRSTQHWQAVVQHGEKDGVPPKGRLASAREYLLPEGGKAILPQHLKHQLHQQAQLS